MRAMRLVPSVACCEEIARRLEAINEQQHLNAILGIDPTAMAQAERCQQLRGQGETIGPLHGIPLIVKDNIACANLPLTLGCRGLASLRASEDALVIRRLRAAGAIILARANMSEFAFDVRSRSSLGGDVHNPLRLGVTAGGSSGGSAAAVAAGMSDAALGTDTGGSIRIPCSYTGLVGLRPAFRREMLQGIAPLSLSKDTVGPMAHTVRDVALLHAIMHGECPAIIEPLPLKGVRLGIIDRLEGDEPQQLSVWYRALARLRQAGVTIIRMELPILTELASRPCLSVDEFYCAFSAWLMRQQGAPDSLRDLVERGECLAEFTPLLNRMMAFDRLKTAQWRRGRRFQRDLYSTLRQAAQAQRINAFLYPSVRCRPDNLKKMAPGCAPELAAVSGLPAITLPCGSDDSGLPVGMELLATSRDEPFLLALALACENVLYPFTEGLSRRD